MMMMNDVLVQMPEGMNEEEAKQYVLEEIQNWKTKGKKLGKVVLELDQDEVVIKAYEKSPIRRIRRITGYLSEQTNFNDAKQAELAERVVHF
ncbi:MAG: anaerobic ribonucleoside triphosphate reductase [Firmicutes bacterium]|nr:anaerobic ribonucleoside triphosphate reductase [Bacillota bacterium]